MAPGLGLLFFALLVGAISLASARPLQDGEEAVELNMPDVQPQVKDTYLCVPMRIDDTKYITGFVPHANMSTAHHMLIYGCEEPGEADKVWNCGEMQAPVANFDMGPVCASGAKIIYAWGMDAPELHLPQDVGFKVGEKTDIPWVVLQVHYKDVHHFLPPENGKDHSGVTLIQTHEPQANRAGVYLLGTNGRLEPHTTTYMETACPFLNDFDIVPFAYRTHAHTHGRVVSGYRVRNGEWEEIGRKDPQKPQMFYNITNPGMVIQAGDFMAARCTMVNDEDRVVEIGSTQNDEMCNFYIMYYVKGQQEMQDNYCFSPGPPEWHWKDMPELVADNAPSDASLVPGETEPVQSTEQDSDEFDRLMMLLDKLTRNEAQYETNDLSYRNYDQMPYGYDE